MLRSYLPFLFLFFALLSAQAPGRCICQAENWAPSVCKLSASDLWWLPCPSSPSPQFPPHLSLRIYSPLFENSFAMLFTPNTRWWVGGKVSPWEESEQGDSEREKLRYADAARRSAPVLMPSQSQLLGCPAGKADLTVICPSGAFTEQPRGTSLCLFPWQLQPLTLSRPLCWQVPCRRPKTSGE